MAKVGAHLPSLEFEQVTRSFHPQQPSIIQSSPSANRADMGLVKSLKSDPLGVLDTRLEMTDPPTDGFFSPFVPSPFTGFDRTNEKRPGSQAENSFFSSFFAPSPFIAFDQTERIQPDGQMKVKASAKQAHRGFDSSHQCPRSELDVGVDKYHTLDGLTEPLNPQNTPASNSERESMEMEDFDFDCFQVSPDASLVLQDDGSESPKSSKLRHLYVGRRQWIKSPAAALANHHPGVNASNFEECDMSGSPQRNVRFSHPADSLSSSSLATHRPLPSIERREDYIALHRQKKQYRKWKLTRHVDSQKCSPYNIDTKPRQSLAARIPKNHDMRVSSLSSLPYCGGTRRTSFFSHVGSGDGAREVRAGKEASNVGDTPVADASKIAGKTKQHAPAFVAVSISLYRTRSALSSSTKKSRRYSFKYQITPTDLPQQPSPHLPIEVERTACHPVIDDLLLHTCFICPAPAVMLLFRVVCAATYPLTNTRAGAVMLYLARLSLYLLMKIVFFVLSKCGMPCRCQWTSDTGYSN
ncbi:uncharacterized protein N7500_003663 [Penicillium coprophilum]|uniref:uncharacterized protein n=1 Tax=Penicillium coprophilum TaxID=36646 RepID=UPI00239B3864|nr:uncharacterized protein N7500_003663 [Penicillium coprophilum]KAJ5170880.1 hypothetical protein N7500_003663 [Penicillium coprophilum]